jgi:hypothetical protein
MAAERTDQYVLQWIPRGYSLWEDYYFDLEASTPVGRLLEERDHYRRIDPQNGYRVIRRVVETTEIAGIEDVKA